MKYFVRILVASTFALAACNSPEIPDFGEPDSGGENNVNNTNNANNTNNNDIDMSEDMEVDIPFDRPDICTVNEQCGPGWLCDIENAECIQGYTNENGVYSDRLVTGIVADQSGLTGDVGRGIVAGVRAYFDHINKTRGGVYGRELELKILNSDGDADKGESLLNAALDNREIFAFIGNQGDTLAAQTVDRFNSENVVLFAPIAGGPSVRQSPPDRYVFTYRVSFTEENARMVDFFVNEQNPPFPAPNFALFTEANADGSLSDLGAAGMAGVAKTLGAEPHRIPEQAIMKATYKKGSTDTSAAIESVIRWIANGERYEVEFMGFPNQIFAMIVITAHDQAASSFIKGIKDDLGRIRNGIPTGYTLSQEEIARIMSSHLLFGLTSSAGDSLAKSLVQAGPDKYCTSEVPGSSNIIFSQVVPFYESNSTTILRYREQLAAYDPSLDPGFASLEGYIAARLYVEALTRAGETLIDENLVEAIESIVDYNDLALAGTPVDFQDHQAMTEVFGTFLDSDCIMRKHEGSDN